MPNSPLIIRAQSIVAGLSLVVDGFPSHQHKMNTRTGGEPLEDGREVTDHAVASPEAVVLQGIVSDMTGNDGPRRAFQAIQELWKNVEPVRVITEWATYPEMLITRCEPVSAGRGMTFEMELREVLRVSATSFIGPLAPPTALSGNAAGRSGTVARGRVTFERALSASELEALGLL